MYKVFISERPLIIKRRQEATVELRDGHLHFHAQGEDELLPILTLLKSDHNIRAIYVYNQNPKDLFGVLTKHFTVIEAAGGFVTNFNHDALFIHRRGFWDLPKGKIDQGESVQEAALREVNEECGIGDLSIVSELPATYHVYTEKGDEVLKITHWFTMVTTTTEEPTPQLDEGIDEVRWVARKHWRELAKMSYPNIADLIETVLTR